MVTHGAITEGTMASLQRVTVCVASSIWTVVTPSDEKVTDDAYQPCDIISYLSITSALGGNLQGTVTAGDKDGFCC